MSCSFAADKPYLLPRVHELARRIRQSVYDVIDPPLSVLEAVGTDLDGQGNGVVVLQVTVTVLDCTPQVRHDNLSDRHFEDDLWQQEERTVSFRRHTN